MATWMHTRTPASGEGRKEEVQSGGTDEAAQSLGQGLRTIMDYPGTIPSTVSGDASLADDLDSFYAWFDASNNTTSGTVADVSSIARDDHT